MNSALLLEYWLQSPLLCLHNLTLTPILTLIPTLTLQNSSFTTGPLMHRVVETLFKVVKLVNSGSVSFLKVSAYNHNAYSHISGFSHFPIR